MRILDFYKEYRSEEACKAHFKANREKEGVVCKRCFGLEHYWLL
jgi:hypothetical protein